MTSGMEEFARLKARGCNLASCISFVFLFAPRQFLGRVLFVSVTSTYTVSA